MYDPTLSIEEEIERDMQRLKDARTQAEELVRARGWSERDDDFQFQIEQETKEQWSELWERDHADMETDDDPGETTP